MSGSGQAATTEQIQFNDGAGYERMMGVWSLLAGEQFLDWIRPDSGLDWVDVGCGNGAFTELLVERCAPASIKGIDPSLAQIDFARRRHTAGLAEFLEGDAMSLPFADASFDAATMALVIFFVPEPAKGMAEMLRVVRPGGLVAAYAWNFPTGGFPMQPLHRALQEAGHAPPLPPSAEVSELDALAKLWSDAGLQDVEARNIVVHRPFASFDAYWDTAMLSPAALTRLAKLTPGEQERIRSRTLELMPRDEAGQLVFRGHASAAKGRVPG